MRLIQIIRRAQLAGAQARALVRESLCSEPPGIAHLHATMLEERLLFSATPLVDPAGSTLVPDAGAGAGLASGDISVSDVSLDSTSQQAASSSAAQQAVRELVFIDTSVDEYWRLATDLESDPSKQVVLIDSRQDGIAIISDTLAAYESLDAIHIVSHGNDSGIQLGNVWLNQRALQGYAGEIAGWQDALATGADLLLYGCNLASSQEGQTLLGSLQELTGADVAASVDLTGHTDLGGDWDLEYARGTIDVGIAFSSAAQNDWDFLLATVTVTTTSDTNDGDTSSINNLLITPGADGAISLREAILAANNTAGSDTIAFNIPGVGPHTIALASALPQVTDAAVIDGFTEPDYAGTPVIRIDGAALSGTNDGLHIVASNTTVRGFSLTNFSRHGIVLSGNNNTLQGNYIGLDTDGSTPGPLGDNGIHILGADNLIGGTTPELRNVVASTGGEGILVNGSSATGNRLYGNYVGTDATGTLDRGAALQGIRVRSGASNNFIGGSNPGEGNLISGNDSDGLQLDGNTTSGNIVRGNFIGTTADGLSALPNDDDGIEISAGANNTIVGGTGSGDRNVVSGNSDDGIQINDVGSVGNIVQGNFIGVGSDGTTPLGNASDGMELHSGASNNLIGGTVAGAGNVIYYNTRRGVRVIDPGTVGNALLGNSIAFNSSIGIDLDGDVVSANDAGDGDVGPNDLLNYPVITGVRASGTSTIVDYTLDVPAGDYRVEFFTNTTLDPSGYGEGETFAGSHNITHAGVGSQAFSATLAGLYPAAYFTATATEDSGASTFGSTSEFGAGFAVTNWLVVDTNSDSVDGDTSSISALIANKGADGFISLREAIQAANNTPNGGDPDYILFNIPGSGPHTISLTSQLDPISEAVVIDATSEPDFAGTPVVELDGSSAGAGVSGLVVSADNVIVRGLAINRFSQYGINLWNATNAVVQGNFLGTDVTGSLDLGNGLSGILISGGSGNTIGGTTASERNVISGNDLHGISMDSSTSSNTVLGNYIGLNAAGTAALSNSDYGIAIAGAAKNNVIGGTAPGARNVISGNTVGIEMAGVGVNGNRIEGNYIGLDASGTNSLPNLSAAIVIRSGADGNTIGGSSPSHRNVLAGPATDGIRIHSSDNTVIQNNFIGTDASGSTAMGFNQEGIEILSSANTLVGGVGSGNVIAGNSGPGIGIQGASNGTVVQGNWIGTDTGGAASLGNSGPGIQVASGDNTTIGGLLAGQGNTIAYNGQQGIAIAAGTGNAILRNSIHSNADLGIDLGADGATSNDSGDPDVGPNDLQNFPILTSATTNGSDLVSISGTLNSQSGQTYRLEFFSSTSGDPSGFGEGQVFLGAQDVTTDGSGDATFTVNFAVAIPAGTAIAATATSPTSNTSEFSPFLAASTPNWLIVDTTDDIADGDTSSIANLLADRGPDGFISLREAILATNNTANTGGPDTIRFDISGSGPHTISVTSALPQITDALIIDGWTEPDFSGAPVIELDGSGGGANPGLTLAAGSDGSIVRGLIINRFSGDGLVIDSANNTIAGTWIGTDVSGTASSGNGGSGISITSSGNTIGGTSTADRNVIGGNTDAGILLKDTGASNNLVLGNYIGVDVSGNNDLANGSYDVRMENGASNNTVGGGTAGSRNVLGSLQIQHPATSGNRVQGNYIGLNAAGTTPIGVANIRVDILDAGSNIIGTDGDGLNDATEGNVIASASTALVAIRNAGASGNVVAGNLIGTDAAGTTAYGAGNLGVWIQQASNNRIGTNSDGTSDALERNVISGNGRGVLIQGSAITATANNVVAGNLIGTDITGTNSLGNVEHGVWVLDGGSANTLNNMVGGTASGAGNVIAFNGGDGVRVEGPASATAILNNAIFSNTGLGIDLGADGVTANDPGDADTGANNLQNYPVLTDAVTDGANLSITGTLQAASGTAYRIDYFASSAADPSGYGQGQRYLGGYSVTTDASGVAAIDGTLPAAVAEGEFITAIATVDLGGGNYGDSSEFSAAVAARTIPPAIDLDADDSSGRTGIDFTTTWTEDGPAVAIADADATVQDDDSPSLASMTVTISNLIDAGSETLTADTTGTSITATYVSGTLTLSGIDSVANYQQVLRSVVYQNASQNPSTTPRIVQVSAFDGRNSSAPATATVNIISINDAPSVTAPGSALSATEQLPLDIHGAGFSVADVDAGGAVLATSLTVDEGTLAVTSGNSGVLITAGNGTGNVTLQGTIGQINDLLTGTSSGTIVYTNPSNTPSPDAVLNVTVLDGGNSGSGGPAQGSGSVTIHVTPINDPPTATADNYTVDQFQTLTIAPAGVLQNDTDPDSTTLQAVLVSGPTYGTLLLQPDGSFVYVPDNAFIGTDAFAYAASDGLASSPPVTVTITVNPVGSSGGPTPDDQGVLPPTEPIEENSESEGSNQTSALASSPAGPQYNLTQWLATASKLPHSTADDLAALEEQQWSGTERSDEAVWMGQGAIRQRHRDNASPAPSQSIVAAPLMPLNDQQIASLVRSSETTTVEMVVGTVAIASSMLSVGYLMWLLRSGSLLASVLSSLPAWQNFDPLPVLLGTERQEGDGESLADIARQPQRRTN